jgi:GPH family glycoside/pentoside/hexuronide:cation symporter
VGALLFAARLVESFDDALIGYWSDRTRSRLGRRLPFILGATPLWALFGFLLFTPPTGSAVATGAYFFVVLELFFLAGTLSGGPYEALFPELARTHPERVSIVTFRLYFGIAGGAVGLVASGLIIDHFGFAAMALVMAALALGFRYLGMIGVWSRAKESRDIAEMPFRDAMRATFSNRYFLLFLPTFVLFQVGLQMVLGVLPFYVEAVLEAENEGTWVAVLTATAIATTAIVGAPLFARLALRTSKRHAYRTAMLGATLGFPLLFFAGFVPGIPEVAQILVVVAVIGAPIAGVYLFPAALTADIADYDAVRTGMRREGAYFGTQNFVEKTTTSVTPLLLAGLLLIGKTTEDPLGIRLVGPVAGLFVLGGYLLFRGYDLPDEVIPPTAAEAAAKTA